MTRKKIIVVDDSITARQQVRNALGALDYEIIEAIDGNDGLEKLTAHTDAALLICDVNMPNMNGLEMLTTLQERSGPHMPIVMLTAEVQPDMLQRAKRAGAKGWIVKPFKADLFVATVRKLVGDA